MKDLAPASAAAVATVTGAEAGAGSAALGMIGEGTTEIPSSAAGAAASLHLEEESGMPQAAEGK